jgi:hypothetical protein
MKTKIIIALVATVALCSIAFFSITKIGLSNPPIPRDSKFSIIGEWKLDTAYNNKDSASLSLLALAFVDASMVFKFNADSSLQIISTNEVTTQRYYVNNDSLFVKEDSAYTLSIVKATTDSLISMMNKDSTVFVMSRKNC